MSDKKDTKDYLKTAARGAVNLLLWSIVGVISLFVGLGKIFMFIVRIIADWITGLLHSTWEKSNNRLTDYSSKILSGFIILLVLSIWASVSGK